MNRVYIIAEAGVNHNGSVEIAHCLIDRAADAGADAVKFQTFKAEEAVSCSAPKAPYQKVLTPGDESQLEMLKRLELNECQHDELVRHCRSRNIEFLSTPADYASLIMLVERLQVSRLKIASGDINNAPLLLEAARTGKSIILSTGMSSLGEVEAALAILAFGYCNKEDKPSQAAFRAGYSSLPGQNALSEKVTLLHCTSEYPARFRDINLLAMDTLARAFGLRVGYSDHSPGLVIPIAAAARGAAVIEKHFTLDRSLPGPDHQTSLEPAALKKMVASIRQVEQALGSSRKFAAGAELPNLQVARKSLVAKKDIQKGEIFSEDNLGIKRPGTGIDPVFYWEYLGRVAEKNYKTDEMIS